MTILTPYQEKLLDQRWKDKRISILERDNFQCRSCGDKHNIFHVHHKYYKTGLEPWEYSDSELMTLCEACHQLHHLLLKLNSKDFPPLFMPPFRNPVSTAYAADVLSEDYYHSTQKSRRVTFAVRRQYKFLLKIIELANQDKKISFDTVTSLAKDKLNDMCIRTNFHLITPQGIFGMGDITDLKPEQYF